jgi:hypothetical protein
MAWAEAHPKLTDAIVIGAAALTALLLVVGLVGVAIITVTPVIEAIGVVIVALTSPIGLLIISIIALVAAIVINWKTIKTDTEALLTDVTAIWTTGWTDISNFVMNIWHTITNTVKTGVNDVIGAINGFINALDAIHISIPAIQIPGTKIGTPALDLGFNIPDIPMLAAGGVVYNPVLAMIGEQGPEAVVPLSSLGGGGVGGQSIVININGGNYLDSQGANMIAQQLAKQVLRGLKVTGYAL